jgi:Resolvase, N terminal domain
MTEQTLTPIGTRGLESKLHDHHLRRQAIVYVRQSHPQQVVEYVESTARQYALAERAIAYGWAPERVIVIDEDQGQSGQSMATRLGFQRLLAEVSLDHVGLILGLELSRLARSNKDWHQLLELCAIFRTLLEPVRITLPHERRSGHRQNAERQDSVPAFCPSGSRCAESGSSTSASAPPPSAALSCLPHAPVPEPLRHGHEYGP